MALSQSKKMIKLPLNYCKNKLHSCDTQDKATSFPSSLSLLRVPNKIEINWFRAKLKNRIEIVQLDLIYYYLI